MHKFLLRLSAALLLTGAVALSSGRPAAVLPTASDGGFSDAARTVTVGDLRLDWDGASALRIENTVTGQSLCSSEAENGLSYASDYVRNAVGSLLSVSFTTGEFAGISEQYLENMNYTVESRAVSDGIQLRFSFPDHLFGFDLQLRLCGDYLELTLPEDSLWEKGDSYLCAVSPLPFLAAGKDSDDGYVFYPDGCGALYRFKNAPIGKAASSTFSVYGTESALLPDTVVNAEPDSSRCRLPVFGIKRNDLGFVGILTAGEAEATITLSPSGKLVNLCRIGCSFIYRSSLSYSADNGETVTSVDKTMTGGDRSVRYYFLFGGDPSYSRMAERCRSYLLETKKLRDAVTADTVPLSLRLFTGIEKQGLLTNSLVTATTFDQAGDIAAALRKAGVPAAELTLAGWTEGGYASGRISRAERRFGGKQGLIRLCGTVSSLGYTLFLDENWADIRLDRLPAGFSPRRDAVLLQNATLLTDADSTRCLAGTAYILQTLLPRKMQEYTAFSGAGIYSGRLGSFIARSGGAAPVSRSETQAAWETVLQTIQTQTGGLSVSDGNAYTFAYASTVEDIPTADSGYLFTDESVPFLQMVLHGSIAYAGQPGNLSADFTAEKLKWVEYGCMPHFEITFGSSSVLADTDYAFLFTSRFADWEQTVADTALEFNTRLGTVWNSAMTAHEKLADGLYRVTYENGCRVYVNYTKTAVGADGLTVPAEDYLVVSAAGEVL